MSATATPRRPADRRRPARPAVSLLMRVEALTLAVFAALHLSGALHIGSGSKPAYGAGVAEALICVALAVGAVALVRWPVPAVRGRRVALGALGFAIFGFLVGLSFTLGSGDPIDLAYHLAMLPLLVGTTALLVRGPTARDHL